MIAADEAWLNDAQRGSTLRERERAAKWGPAIENELDALAEISATDSAVRCLFINEASAGMHESKAPLLPSGSHQKGK